MRSSRWDRRRTNGLWEERRKEGSQGEAAGAVCLPLFVYCFFLIHCYNEMKCINKNEEDLG